jgi:hypothetical protein
MREPSSSCAVPPRQFPRYRPFRLARDAGVYDRGVIKRPLSVVAVVALALLALTGCQAGPGSFSRAAAKADVEAWTHGAQKAAGSAAATTKSDGYETCRTDSGLFTMRFQWRTITNLAVGASDQSAVTADISKAFSADDWTEKDEPGLVTLAGPKSAKRRGLIQIQTAGDSQLSISVISPCYP